MNTCFGCGPDNPQGLKVRAFERGDGTVAAELRLPEHFHGGPGIAHGGIQATVLDEVMGYAVHAAIGDSGHRYAIVTVELTLRYLRPAPIEASLLAVARATTVDVPSIWVEAALRDEQGTVLTSAEAEWRVLGPRGARVVGDA